MLAYLSSQATWKEGPYPAQDLPDMQRAFRALTVNLDVLALQISALEKPHKAITIDKNTLLTR